MLRLCICEREEGCWVGSDQQPSPATAQVGECSSWPRGWPQQAVGQRVWSFCVGRCGPAFSVVLARLLLALSLGIDCSSLVHVFARPLVAHEGACKEGGGHAGSSPAARLHVLAVIPAL